MATSPTNRITRSISQKSLFEDSSAVTPSTLSYNQGDLLAFDTSAHVLKLMAAEGDAVTFVGIARETVLLGNLKRPFVTPVDGSFGADVIAGPVYGVIAKLQLKSGDTLNPGDDVYADPVTGNANVQAAGTKPIGTYEGPAVTAGASTYVEVLLGARYPNDTLKF